METLPTASDTLPTRQAILRLRKHIEIAKRKTKYGSSGQLYRDVEMICDYASSNLNKTEPTTAQP